MLWPRDSIGLVRRNRALDVGITDLQLKRAVRSGELTMVDRGRYAITTSLPAVDVLGSERRDTEVHRLRCLAAALDDNCRLALSHESAATVLGLATLLPDRDVVHFGTAQSSGGRRLRTRHVHTALPSDSTMTIDGIEVTTPARTAVDIAATRGFVAGLAVCDSALRLGVTADQLFVEFGKRRIRGAADVRAAIRYADGRSANPYESWGRALMIQSGFPLPDLQTHFVLPDGSHAYADYSWRGKLVAEYDGRRKYWRDLRPGDDPGDVVYREKQREDGLRALKLGVCRWVTKDLYSKAMITRVREALLDEGLL
ncbi:hypothetical protein [Gordonia sp. (in: high G+C Gram-positive bacteria)]|uniref:hypothetical protein n=1 Tax=Gordonia sp. (in: high G+C Gram-positive bacteria) TaxID=84139 RepID=UPI0016B671A1|nr:hypothetical protein [Gordonia sp. (in: high G+C Gram-positive bacteria)]NLG47718.1 type IV toxin-antitoxin system AbiEi family antitoxin domain-containing protein [Gordonia sp. (in: high G+C Gram-positive bacteria)]